jgi:hypothetical protein
MGAELALHVRPMALEARADGRDAEVFFRWAVYR